eukprot:5091296-Pyramimonas_sp.AAC.1
MIIPHPIFFVRPASRRCLFADHPPAKTQLLDASKRDASPERQSSDLKASTSKDPPGRQAVIRIKARRTEQSLDSRYAFASKLDNLG